MTSTLVMVSPVGALRLRADADGITGISFVDEELEEDLPPSQHIPVLIEARRQLTDYFDGRRKVFQLPLAATGTQFQRAVWAELLNIPFGATTTYGEIAHRLGMSPGASRAVGMANGANPIGIVVPCHRVIGAKGKLIGFSGGLDRKRYLLGLESSTPPQGALFR